MFKNEVGEGLAGILRPGEVLTVEAAMRAVGVREWGWRRLSADVPKIKAGRRLYVLSDDLIHHFRRLRDEQTGGQL